MKKSDLAQRLVVAAELCDKELSDTAIEYLVTELQRYDTQVIEVALQRVVRFGRFSYAEIVKNIDDGRPGVEEAWAMMPLDESDSVVWTAEMEKAYFSALPLIEQGDSIAARMVFKEKYTALLSKAHGTLEPVKWTASLGHDPEKRELVLRDAVMQKKLNKDEAMGLLPAAAYPVTKAAQTLLENHSDAIEPKLIDDGLRAEDYLKEIEQQENQDKKVRRVEIEKSKKRNARYLDLVEAFGGSVNARGA